MKKKWITVDTVSVMGFYFDMNKFTLKNKTRNDLFGWSFVQVGRIVFMKLKCITVYIASVEASKQFQSFFSL